MNILQFLLILKAHAKLMLFILVLSVALVGAVTLKLPKVYRATASVVVERGTDPVTGLSVREQRASSYLATQVEVVESRRVALKVADHLGLAHGAEPGPDASEADAGVAERDRIADALLKSLDVKTVSGSSVLHVAYESTDPQTAARLANAFVQAYIETTLELKTHPAKQTAVWYDQQLTTLRENLEKAQDRLSRHQRSEGIVSLDEKLDIESTRLAELSNQVAAAQGQTYDSLSIQNHAGSASASVVDNPVIQGLKAELARREAKFSQLAQRVGSNHPEYRRSEAELESLRGKLAGEIDTARQSIDMNLSVARQRERELRTALASQKSRVLALNATRDAGLVLAREVESAQHAYDQALDRFSQTQLEGHADQTEISVLSTAAVPQLPSAPNVNLNMALSILFGLLLGIGLALVSEMLSPRVRSGRDVANALDVPVLGILTRGKKRKRPARRGRPAPHSEKEPLICIP